MGVGGWRQADHLDLDALLRDAGERDRLLGELREHGIELVCVNAAGNPLHPDPAVGDRHAALLRGAVELAALVGCDRVVTMSGCPGGRDGGATPVFASWPVVPDDESLWEWQYEHRLAPFWRELGAWAAHAAPSVMICLELHAGASAYNPASFARIRAAAGPNVGVNLDPSHFWWQGMDPVAVIEEVGPAIGFAHGKDTLVHADRVRRNGLLDLGFPVDPETASWHFSAVGTGHDDDTWAALVEALRGAGYDGVISIEHEDPRVTPEEGIETSLADAAAGLRAGRGGRVSATMHDVARRSGVSVATVSNVLHNTAPVADDTRRRVLDAIDELGYRTNEVARSLKRRVTQTLGVVMPDVLNPFHAAIARQIERRAHRDGFAVVISATEYDRDTEADQVRALVAPPRRRGHLPGRDGGLGDPRRAARPRHPGRRRLVRRPRPPPWHRRHRRGRGDDGRRRPPGRARPPPHRLRAGDDARGGDRPPAGGPAGRPRRARPGRGRACSTTRPPCAATTT